ncbi:MAG: 4-(cytidine 5'-diphospho)-2-C-methyl-D-erythritol kinase [Acidiferrobacterales bacterium]
MSGVGWPAPAKINLFLHINRQREDGYHELQTVFQFLDYVDELSFSVTHDTVIRHTRLPTGIDAENELCVRAARLLQQHGNIDQGVEITLDKRIPPGGGFGGGSSDAATTLQALNRLWGANLPQDELAGLGLQLGADVPVFLRGQTAWAEGVGERLTPIALDPRWYLLLVPDVQIITADIFSRPELTRDSPPITIRAFREGRVRGQLRNDLEPVVIKLYPQVDEVLQWLRSFGDPKFGNPRMTGSGAGVFLPVKNREQGEKILAQCPGKWTGYVAQGLAQSPLVRRLAQEN